MHYEIGDILITILFVLLFALIVFILVKIRVSKWGNETENETEKKTKARAKILFKSIDEYEGTRYPDLTTYHVTNYYVDCQIYGVKKTFCCCEYMYNFVQKGETYDVLYTKHWIELDRKYYPEDFDDFFEEFDDPDIEE